MLPELPSFEDFFEAIHEYRPYPWQSELARRVVEDGCWPDTVGVPTGGGKTAALDVAIYALAQDADHAPDRRRAPRRVIMVVDRRTIVDQSFRRACQIREALVGAETGPLVAIRERLLALMGRREPGDEPLQIALMRGGVPRDDGWARRPDQALLAVSTVDQVGSRLLFRGYGVRPKMMSVHAGLLGQDTLLLLDEVHLARPFQETLGALRTHWRAWTERPLGPDRWQFVSLSATSGSTNTFGLRAADQKLPRLRKRLDAAKPLELILAKSTTHDKLGQVKAAWVKALVSKADDYVKAGAKCVGVVVNRVDTARAVAEKLSQTKQREVQLVTGRMRDADRAVAAQRLDERAGPDWAARRPPKAPPFLCVATQTIEAGADLDFDAMVTEVAALDSLVQRFGRANRTGDHSQAPIAVVAPKDVLRVQDPVYGTAIGHAWSWLATLSDPIDVGVDRLTSLLATAPSQAMAPSPCAAVLLPAHLDLLSQTGPRPEPDPDPAHYLHGLDPPRPEVQVVWRADLGLSSDEDEATMQLLQVPPTSFEALALPLGVARRWLAGDPAGSFADVGGDRSDETPARDADANQQVLVWDGERAIATQVTRIGPGQTLVLPAAFGGIESGNFSPAATEPVLDIGDLGRTVRTGRPVLRLDPRVHGEKSPTGAKWPGGLASPPPTPDGVSRTLAKAREEIADWVSAVRPPPGEFNTLLEHIREVGFTAHPMGRTWVLAGKKRLATDTVLDLARRENSPPADDARTADDESVVSGQPVLLDAHLRHVSEWLEALAIACGLDSKHVDDLRLVGRLHDLGKAHPGFQILLHGGDEIQAAAAIAGDRPLAKSGLNLRDKASRQRAAHRARLPRGFRHEMATVALLMAAADGLAPLSCAHDPELVLHLIASHHGHARPFAPPEDHSQASAVRPVETSIDGGALVGPGDHGMDRVDSGVGERFWLLQRRYGWWGLAWLEAIVRLADHRASEEEELHPGGSR